MDNGRRRSRFSRACVNDCDSCGSMLRKIMMMNDNVKGLQEQCSKYDTMANRLRVRESFRALEGDFNNGGGCGNGFLPAPSRQELRPVESLCEADGDCNLCELMKGNGSSNGYKDSCNGCQPKARCVESGSNNCCDACQAGMTKFNFGQSYDGGFNGCSAGRNGMKNTGCCGSGMNGMNGMNGRNGMNGMNGMKSGGCCLETSDSYDFRDSIASRMCGRDNTCSDECDDCNGSSVPRSRILESLAEDKRDGCQDSGVDRMKVLDSFNEPEQLCCNNDWADSRTRIRDSFKDPKSSLSNWNMGQSRGGEEGCCWGSSY